jgi:hypothetical protein
MGGPESSAGGGGAAQEEDWAESHGRGSEKSEVRLHRGRRVPTRAILSSYNQAEHFPLILWYLSL